jgi:amino acid permease
MRSLAELISVISVKSGNGALMKFPSLFVDEALGFAVGVVYW